MADEQRAREPFEVQAWFLINEFPVSKDEKIALLPSVMKALDSVRQSAIDEVAGPLRKMLEPLRALHEAATPPPWRAGRSDMVSYSGTGEDGPFKNIYVDDPEPKMHLGRPLPLTVARGETDACVENAELIAALRNALPDLLNSLAPVRAEGKGTEVRDGE